jgi:hypothetical protein
MSLHELPKTVRDDVADIGFLSQLKLFTEDLFESTKNLILLNMDARSKQIGTYESMHDSGIEKITVVGTAGVGTAANASGYVRAVEFDGTVNLDIDSYADFDETDINVSVGASRADWGANPASDQTLLSILDADDNGITLVLENNAGWATAGDPVNLVLSKVIAGSATALVTEDVNALSAGYHTIGIEYEMGVGQDLLIDGASVGTDTDTDVLIEKTADSVKTITGITNASNGVVTATSHGFSNGDKILIEGVKNMRGINGKVFTISDVSTHTFKIDYDTTKAKVYGGGGKATKKTPLVITIEVGEDFVGNIDNVVIQTDGLWDADMHELLANIKGSKIIVQDRDGGLVEMDTTSL